MNRRTGRPPNRRLWLALLERLPTESVGELIRSGSFTRPQLSHYLRQLRRGGFVHPLTVFSHLPSDGPGAKRYGLTRNGRRLREKLRSTESPPGVPTVTTVRKSAALPGGAEVRPRPRSIPSRSEQVFVGAHNFGYQMIIESRFRRELGFDKSTVMRGGWVSRHTAFGRGITIQETGGARWDPPGSAGHKIRVSFRIPRPESGDPREVAGQADARVEGVRRLLETEYGCTLSEPELITVPKYSALHDPLAEAIRDAGVTVHGEVGVDDTPEPATLEFSGSEAAERVRKYTDGVGRIGELADKVDLVAAKIDGLTGATEKMAESVGRLVDRLLQPETAQVRRDPGKVGPSEAIGEGFG